MADIAKPQLGKRRWDVEVNAVIDKVNLPLVLNVRAFGAKGDGTTDDTTALRAAITAAGTQGCVYFPSGTYITQKLTIGSGVWLVGAGYEATILKLKAGANSHLVETTNFDALIGTDTVTGPFNFGVIGMTLDGNQANNPTGGHGLAIYGYGYTFRDIRIREAKGWGLWTEWAQQSSSPGNDSMESSLTDFKIHHCTGGGIYLKGPHDTHIHNGIVYYVGPDTDGSGSAAIFVPTNNFANGSIIANVHIWGASYDYGIDINSTGIMVIDCQLESAYTAQLRIRGNNNIVRDTKVFSGGIFGATTKGIVIEGGVTQNWISGKGENLGGGAIDLTGSGGQNNIDFYNVYFGGTTSATPLVGTVDSASAVIFHNIQDGAVTADSLISFPQKIKTAGTTIGGPYASGVGINTGNNASNALTVTTGTDTKNGVVVYANSATQSGHLLRLQSSAFADLVRVDATGRMFMASATAPGTPTGGAWVYVESGALKIKGSAGTVFTTAQQAAVASPTADVTALKTAVDGLRAALQASGLLAP